MTRLLPMFAVAAVFTGALAQQADAKVDFAKQIQPILAKHCYKCHGEKEKSDLVLHTKAGIIAGGEYEAEDGLKTLVSKDAEKSMLYVLTTTEDRALDVGIDFMPTKGDGLTDAEKTLLKQWINEGADFGDWTESKIEKQGEIILKEVKPAPKAAVDRLTQAGALAMPIARNTNLLNIDFRAVAGDIGDSHLELLKPVAVQTYWLGLARTKVSDAGLAHLKDMASLKRLHLEGTAIGDAGLEHLEGLGDLEYLNLYGTKVTDAGLVHLAKLGNLRALYLWQTGVTDAGVAKLSKLLPDCRIDTGYKPAPPKPAAAAAINKKCPVSGKPVDATKFVIYEGQKVGFCCDNCKGKFEKDPKPFVGKIENFKPAAKAAAAGAEPFNNVCPVSGKGIDASQFVDFKGKKVCFCCGNCKAKFVKDSKPFIAKIKAAK